MRTKTLNQIAQESVKGERFKCIGNGWTVDVVAHIFKGLLNENL